MALESDARLSPRWRWWLPRPARREAPATLRPQHGFDEIADVLLGHSRLGEIAIRRPLNVGDRRVEPATDDLELPP
jgi:hypothetical protein